MVKYDSYKDSGVEWIGEIPSNWKFFKLWLTIESSGLGGNYNGSTENEGYPFIKMGNIGRGNIILNKVEYIEKTDKIDKNHFLKDGDFLFNTRNSVELVGKVSLWRNELKDSLFNLNLLRIKFKPFVLNEFMCYLFNSKSILDVLRLISKGTTSVSGIYFKDLSKIEIPLPTFFEQQQIVPFLDTKTSLIDSLIEKTQNKIELLKEKRTSLINHTVTKGLNHNVEMKDSGVGWIGEIPFDWNLISIKHLVSTKITDGPHETPTWVDKGIPFLSVESVQDNKLDFNKKRGYISPELHEIYSKKCKPQRDDIFIVKSGSTTGKSTIVETDEDFNIWSPLCIVRSNKNKVLPRFIFSSIQSFYFRRFVELGWSFGTQPNIGMGVIENIRIVVPPIQEQQQIVDYLDVQTEIIDTTITKEQKRIKLLKEYRQSLISEVVTGKIKVTNE